LDLRWLRRIAPRLATVRKDYNKKTDFSHFAVLMLTNCKLTSDSRDSNLKKEHSAIKVDYQISRISIICNITMISNKLNNYYFL